MEMHSGMALRKYPRWKDLESVDCVPYLINKSDGGSASDHRLQRTRRIRREALFKCLMVNWGAHGSKECFFVFLRLSSCLYLFFWFCCSGLAR